MFIYTKFVRNVIEWVEICLASLTILRKFEYLTSKAVVSVLSLRHVQASYFSISHLERYRIFDCYIRAFLSNGLFVLYRVSTCRFAFHLFIPPLVPSIFTTALGPTCSREQNGLLFLVSPLFSHQSVSRHYEPIAHILFSGYDIPSKQRRK